MANVAGATLAIGYLAVLAWGAYELRQPGETMDAAATTATATYAVPALVVEPPPVVALDGYEAIVERPLFVEGRRPAAGPVSAQTEKAEEADSDVPEELGDLHLTAVVHDAATPTALVEDRFGETRVLRIGDMLGGWKVRAILDDSLVMVAGSDERTLPLFRFDAPPPVRPQAESTAGRRAAALDRPATRVIRDRRLLRPRQDDSLPPDRD